MNTLPVLVVDKDDVLNTFNHSFIAYNQTAHKMEKAYDDITVYDYRVSLGFTEADMHERIDDFFAHHHDTVGVMPHAASVLTQLKQSYELHIVTSRCESLTTLTHAWLDHHLPNIFTAVHFTNGFATKFPERRRTKLALCQSLCAVALVDDAPVHVESVAKELGIPVFMFDKPWNQHVELPLVTRVYDADGWLLIKEALIP